jgi:hypothetical protein
MYINQILITNIIGRIEIEYEDDEIREKITDTNLEFNF